MVTFEVSDIWKSCEELLKFSYSEQQYFSIEAYGTDNEQMMDAKSLIGYLVLQRDKILSSLTLVHCNFEKREFIELLDRIQLARSVVLKKPATPLTIKNIETLVSVLQGAENLRSLTFEEWDDLTPEMNELLAPDLRKISERASNSDDEAKDAKLLNIFKLWSQHLGEKKRSKEFQEFALKFEFLEDHDYNDQLVRILKSTEILVDILINEGGKELKGMEFRNCTEEVMKKQEIRALLISIRHINNYLHFQDTPLSVTTIDYIIENTMIDDDAQLKKPDLFTLSFVRCDLIDHYLHVLKEFFVKAGTVRLEENPRLTREGFEKLIAFYKSQEKSGGLVVKDTTKDLSDLSWGNKFLFS